MNVEVRLLEKRPKKTYAIHNNQLDKLENILDNELELPTGRREKVQANDLRFKARLPSSGGREMICRMKRHAVLERVTII